MSKNTVEEIKALKVKHNDELTGLEKHHQDMLKDLERDLLARFAVLKIFVVHRVKEDIGGRSANTRKA